MTKPIREKPLLLMMSKASMAVHHFLFEHRLKEAATSKCKHQLAKSINSHCDPTPTG